MEQLKTWLERPYPLTERRATKWIIILGFSIFTYFFLLLYQPYGAAEIPGKSLFLAGFGCCVFLVLAVNYFVLPKLLPGWFEANQWQIKKEILYLSFCFLGIAMLNFLYNSTVGKDIAPPFGLLEFIGITVSVGIFPLLVLLYFNERRLTTGNQQLAEAVSIPENSKEQNGSPVLLIEAATSTTPKWELPLEQFVYAVAEDNYTTVHYQRANEPGRRLLRLSLKSLEQQLQDHPDIVRCHRSYLINRMHLIAAEGNARSLYLRLRFAEASVPVSRKMSSAFLT